MPTNSFWARALFVVAALLLVAEARAELGLNFPPPASDAAREIYDIHMLTFYIATVLMVVVSAVVIYAIWKFRKDRGYRADDSFHYGWFGKWSWVIVPVLVLGVDLTIAGSAERVLQKVWEVPDDREMLAVKVTGHQWWWQFDYLDHGVRVDSRFVPKAEAGAQYLREVDNRLVLPTGMPIHFLHTSADVNHAFWIPELGVKKDAVAGYITETWTTIEKEGVFRGQCAELCGTWHARMPLVVEAVSPARFDAWLTERKAELQAAVLEADPNRVWSRADLMARGEQEYNTLCAACHMPNGEGMPPAFPALKGSSIINGGQLREHIRTVLDGRPGTAMQSWAHLTDLQVAAIVTYERNAFGNGDALVQPAMVKAER